MPRNQLTISPAPFKSSYLAIPPTPFSPLLPISPPPRAESTTKPLISTDNIARLKATAALLLPPPPEPLHWLWQCHKCARVYQLGVTRRCLDDGHVFCAGTTVVKKSRKGGRRTVRHAACASEFDYSGWKGWGSWRRGLGERVEAARVLEEEDRRGEEVMGEGAWFSGAWNRRGGERLFPDRPAPLRLKKDCWARCDYPSECRWGKQFGVATPQLPSSPPTTTTTRDQVKKSLQEEIDIVVAATQQNTTPKTTFEDILIDITDPASLDYLSPLTCSPDVEGKSFTESETKMTSVGDLLQSAQRRKRKSSNSIPLIPGPLALNPPSPPAAEEVKKLEEGEGALETLARVVIEDGEKKGSSGTGRVLQHKASEFVAGWKFGKGKGKVGA